MRSCVGCKFLYGKGEGYSNYTWESTGIKCALDKNPNLPKERPEDWNIWDSIRDDRVPPRMADNWPATQNSKCEEYSSGQFIELDIESEDGPGTYSQDEEQIQAICRHSGRRRNGGELSIIMTDTGYIGPSDHKLVCGNEMHSFDFYSGLQIIKDWYHERNLDIEEPLSRSSAVLFKLIFG